MTNRYGFTLIEMLVTLFILSLLSSVALPYAEVMITRDKEVELSRALRDVRGAIDRFHEDWSKGKISTLSSAASGDGYPKSLSILVQGVELSGGGIKRYLRRIPKDPFADPLISSDLQWVTRGYQDKEESSFGFSADVYDIRSLSNKTALNGTSYKDW